MAKAKGKAVESGPSAAEKAEQRRAYLATLTDEQRRSYLQQERRDRTVRLAGKRVQKALDAIENVAAMGNKATWSLTEQEEQRIIADLSDAVRNMAEQLVRQKRASKTSWTL